MLYQNVTAQSKYGHQQNIIKTKAKSSGGHGYDLFFFNSYLFASLPVPCDDVVAIVWTSLCFSRDNFILLPQWNVFLIVNRGKN